MMVLGVIIFCILEKGIVFEKVLNYCSEQHYWINYPQGPPILTLGRSSWPSKILDSHFMLAVPSCSVTFYCDQVERWRSLTMAVQICLGHCDPILYQDFCETCAICFYHVQKRPADSDFSGEPKLKQARPNRKAFRDRPCNKGKGRKSFAGFANSKHQQELKYVCICEQCRVVQWTPL
jgi:hypothetical protein